MHYTYVRYVSISIQLISSCPGKKLMYITLA